MKLIINIVIDLIVLMQTSLNLFAQPIIKIDENLKAASEQMSVKRKGLSAVGNYEFGSYKIISSKSGWEKVTSRSGLFSRVTSTKSTVKKSFVLVDDQNDTSAANILITKNVETDKGSWFSRTILNSKDVEIKKGEGLFETEFNFNTDSTLWHLAVIYPVFVEKQENNNSSIYVKDTSTKFKGIFTDGLTNIEIRRVTDREDGKKSIFNPVAGYQFFRNNESIAAVQVLPFNKMYVWIKKNLDNNMKFVLANALVVMMIKEF
jgi:hypothetical protein